MDSGCSVGITENRHLHCYTYTCHGSSCALGILPGDVVGFMDVPTGNEQSLTEAVKQEHVSVATEAVQSSFQLYRSGSQDACSRISTGLNSSVAGQYRHLMGGSPVKTGDDLRQHDLSNQFIIQGRRHLTVTLLAPERITSLLVTRSHF